MRYKIESVRRILLFAIKLFKLCDCDFLVFDILESFILCDTILQSSTPKNGRTWAVFCGSE